MGDGRQAEPEDGDVHEVRRPRDRKGHRKVWLGPKSCWLHTLARPAGAEEGPHFTTRSGQEPLGVHHHAAARQRAKALVRRLLGFVEGARKFRWLGEPEEATAGAGPALSRILPRGQFLQPY